MHQRRNRARWPGEDDRAYANPDPALPTPSPRVEFAWSVSDYDRLARRAEWTTDERGEE
jgi:hypothetical protein